MTADDLNAPCSHGSVAAVCPACLDAYVDEEATLAELEEPAQVTLSDEERDALREWWDGESDSNTAGDMLANLDHAVERIVAARLAQVYLLAVGETP